MDKLKKIISQFIKTDPDQINSHTLINKKAIQGSILIHRMYSAISRLGYIIEDYSKIERYGDLLRVINNNELPKDNPLPVEEISKKSGPGIGIDIEDIKNFPKVSDYREDQFYKDNFSPREISYCIMQQNPQESFAGKFSAKEAIVKADNSYMGIPFREIEILNDQTGKPVFKDFEISISHSNKQSVSVAIKNHILGINNNTESNNEANELNIQVRSLRRRSRIMMFIMMVLTGIIIYLITRS